MTQSETEFLGSTASNATSSVQFWANFSNGTQKLFTITSVATSNPSVDTSDTSGNIALAGGTGATRLSYQLTTQALIANSRGQCVTETLNSTGNVWATANYWDPTVALDIFRSPGDDSSWSIASFSGTGADHYGVPSLNLDNGSGSPAGVHRADFPLQWTNEQNGSNLFSDSQGQSNVLVYNPEANENGWWATNGTDEHLAIADVENRDYWEFYHLQAANGASAPTSLNVGQIVARELNGDAGKTGTDLFGYTGTASGANASKVSDFATEILPGELACATCINHALAITVPSDMNGCVAGSSEPTCAGQSYINSFTGSTEQCDEGPKQDSDGTAMSGPVSDVIFCEGAKIFLPSSFTLQQTSPAAPQNVWIAAEAIVNALKLYGGIVLDQGPDSGSSGGTIGFYTAGYYDTDDPPSPMPPSTLDYTGISGSAMAGLMAEIGANLRIAYTCPFGCSN